MDDNIKNTLELFKFVNEQSVAGQLSKETSEKIKSLWDEYKITNPNNRSKYSIIDADFGVLGSLVVRDVKKFEDNYNFKYESGNYDFISIISEKTTRILWTDYKDIEPYNRQSGLYCSGASFDHLGKPIKETESYREFNGVDKYGSNICFAVWGFSYNDFYGSITFGICLKTNKVDEFINKLRKIINK